MTRSAQTWSAVRYRRSQSLVLVIVSALVTTLRGLRAAFVRTLEHGLLQARLIESDSADTSVLIRVARTVADPDVTPADLAAVMPLRPPTGAETGSA